MGWSNGGKGRGTIVDPSVLLEPGVVDVLHNLLRVGALVSFGLSRDGGSCSSTVTYDGEWDRDWFRDPLELCSWLQDCLARILAQADNVQPLATAGGQRSRNGAPRRGR